VPPPVGNREFNESRLKGVIKTTEFGWLSFLKTSGRIVPRKEHCLHRNVIDSRLATRSK
jgi:hypothetical protein